MLLTVAFLVVLLSTLVIFSMMLGKKKWDPRGKHCCVTGGSAGLGLGLALLLVKRGAHVSIVARNRERLDTAMAELEAARQTPDQVIKAYSYAVDQCKDAKAALEAVSAPHGGRCPDALFLCAGKSRPGFFVEQTEENMRLTMQETYWAQTWSALAATKQMVRDGVKGKIVFVASVLAYFSIVGYSPYSPGKFAIRGLAEALQSEFMLYGIDVHICFPGNILSPGYIEENEVKPDITLKLEESDSGLKPSVIAEHLLKGVEKGKFHITYDFIGNAFRASSRGSSPGNNSFMDQIYSFIAAIGMPIWRRDVDRQVRAHAEEHREYLLSKGLISSDISEPTKSTGK